jgi:hypothetical protein
VAQLGVHGFEGKGVVASMAQYRDVKPEKVDGCIRDWLCPAQLDVVLAYNHTIQDTTIEVLIERGDSCLNVVGLACGKVPSQVLHQQAPLDAGLCANSCKVNDEWVKRRNTDEFVLRADPAILVQFVCASVDPSNCIAHTNESALSKVDSERCARAIRINRTAHNFCCTCDQSNSDLVCREPASLLGAGGVQQMSVFFTSQEKAVIVWLHADAWSGGADDCSLLPVSALAIRDRPLALPAMMYLKNESGAVEVASVSDSKTNHSGSPANLATIVSKQETGTDPAKNWHVFWGNSKIVQRL